MARLIGARFTRTICAIPLFIAAAPALAQNQRLGGGGGLDISLMRIVTALILCLMIAVFAALLLKRSGGKPNLASLRQLFVSLPGERRVSVIESRRISQHADLCIVRCDDHEYLILSSAQQQQILHQAPVSTGAEP